MSDFQDQDKKNGKGSSNNNLFWIYGLIIAFVVIAVVLLRTETNGFPVVRVIVAAIAIFITIVIIHTLITVVNV